jgi:phage RecT family recombinase
MSTAPTPARRGRERPDVAQTCADLKAYMESQITELAKAAPKTFSPEQMIQVVGILTYKTPRLLECSKASIQYCLTQAAGLGLDLNPAMPEAYLIPRWNRDQSCYECTFMTGYQGLARLATEAGNLRFLRAMLVYEKDEFTTWMEDGEFHVRHKEYRAGPRGDVILVYAITKLQTGEPLYEVMTIDEVHEIRNRAESWKKDGERSVWGLNFGEMARKTAIRRLTKTTPRGVNREATARLAEAIAMDNADFEPIEAEQPKAAIDNGTHYGKTGQYASPEETKEWLDDLDAYLEKCNQAWLDKWTGKGGQTPEGLGELCQRNRVDNHLAKWCAASGLITIDDRAAKDGQVHRQIGRYTAIVFHRSPEDRKALLKERQRYIGELAKAATEELLKNNQYLDMEEGDRLPEGVGAGRDEDSDVWAEGRE